MLVFRLFTEILNEVTSSNDIKFTEGGEWMPIQSKALLSKTRDDKQSFVVHTVTGLYSIHRGRTG